MLTETSAHEVFKNRQMHKDGESALAQHSYCHMYTCQRFFRLCSIACSVAPPHQKRGLGNRWLT
eukprot:4378738-Amphidinium_carterae.1